YRLSSREIADALEVCSAPLVERLRFLQLQALSYLIGNGDLHGKNISVQVIEGRVCLTPIYDLLSTLPYGDESLALQLEGRDKKLRRKDFIAWGERVGVRRPATERMLDALVRGVGPCIARLNEIGLGERKTRHMQRVISERLALTLLGSSNTEV
ncbi:MAG: HipA domain-containing protein, partial [Dehalococcoidia bacterium]